VNEERKRAFEETLDFVENHLSGQGPGTSGEGVYLTLVEWLTAKIEGREPEAD
jgi:hypothetical protein